MWPNPQFPADLVTFTEEILNGKIHFLCSAKSVSAYPQHPPPKLLQLFSNYKGIIYNQIEFIIFRQK